MRLEGIHHVTCITGDAPGNVTFYTGVLGLRMVKKTVNQDDPTVYHLFYADELGSPGADITFFEYPGARRGRAGEGMIHTIVFRVASEAALDFWERRLGRRGRRHPSNRTTAAARGSGGSRPRARGCRHARRAAHRAPSRDPRGTRTPGLRRRPRLRLGAVGEPGVAGRHPRLRPRRRVVLGCPRSARGGLYAYDPPPASGRGVPGAGTVHHIAFASHIRRARGLARRRPGRRAQYQRHHRPLLVPFDLLP